MSSGVLNHSMVWIILGIIISYLIGSIPTAYIAGKILKGIDIRKAGSGNVGATNALRVLGKKAGISVLLIDILKGVFAVILVGDYILSQGITDTGGMLRIILGLSCISGHNWTIFLNFKGGKGVAASLGVLIGLAFKIEGFGLILGLVILTWLITFSCVRIVSVASVLAGIALPVFMILFKHSKILVFFSVIMAIFIIFRHRSNLKRVIQGKELPLSFKKFLCPPKTDTSELLR